MAVDQAELEEEPHERPLQRRLLVIVPALVLVGLVAYGASTRVEPKVAHGATAPGFDLPLLDGTGTLSSDDLRGSPVVINFFASWCLPCREEAPVLEQLSREYADEGVRVVGVNVQGGLPSTLLDSQAGAEDFVEEFGITYPVVVDEDGDLARALMEFYGLPQTFFVDHEWTFAGAGAGDPIDDRGGAAVLGAISPKTLERQVKAMAEEARGG